MMEFAKKLVDNHEKNRGNGAVSACVIVPIGDGDLTSHSRMKNQKTISMHIYFKHAKIRKKETLTLLSKVSTIKELALIR